MGWMTAAAVIGSSLLSAESSSDAASTAARASGQASAASIAEQRRQYDLSRADQAPFLAAGTGAVNRLGAGVGYGGEFGATTPFNFQYDQTLTPARPFVFGRDKSP
jgi:opacity protein-like surface antigen